MHKKVWRPDCAWTRRESLSAPLDLLPVVGVGGKERGRKKEGKGGGEGKERGRVPPLLILLHYTLY